jgi:hypothetical protein
MRIMKFKTAWYIFTLIILLQQGCGVLFYREEDERKRQEAEYRPYQQKNSIEAYQEFIKKFPDNLFVSEAKCSIEFFEFAPYEQKDTIEGYRDFMKSYPANRNITRAVEKIDQLEFKQAEDADTIAGYREFLRQHPRSNYIMLAQQRLQDLEFRDLDTICQQQFRFDLLLYRLNVNRLQQQLEPANADIADFTLFASLPRLAGKRCFNTNLIYGDVLLQLDANSKSSDLLFNFLISKLLIYLDQKFTIKKDVEGFCFTVSSSANRFYGEAIIMLEYFFPTENVHQFALGQLKPEELFARARVTSPAKPAQTQNVPGSIPTSQR